MNNEKNKKILEERHFVGQLMYPDFYSRMLEDSQRKATPQAKEFRHAL